jgi:predicted transcriptional regulator
VQRQPDGTFALAEYGKLVLQLSSSFEFVAKYRDYFATHDLMQLPVQFVNRIGELSRATLLRDTIGVLNRGQHAYMEAEQFGWGIAEGTIPESMNQIMESQLQKGIKLQFMLPESRLSTQTAEKAMSNSFPNLETRTLVDLPGIVIVTEKEAGICLRQKDGRIDYAGFFGKDPLFVNWAKDLFLHYWNKGKRV